MEKNKVTVEEDKFRIILDQWKREDESRTIDVRTSRNSSLTVGGCDSGPFVKEFWGKYDYEYDATVAAEDKNTLYSALQKELFNDNDEFKPWLADNGIDDVEANFNMVLLLMLKKLGLYPHDFESWAKKHDIDVHFWSYP